MATSSLIGTTARALAVAFIALAACGGRAAPTPTPTGATSDSGASGVGAPSTGIAGGDDDGGGEPTFGEGGSYDALPPIIHQNGPAPEGIGAGPLVPGTCPIALPAPGDACTVAGARCSYGNSRSPLTTCRDWVACSDGVWTPESKEGANCDAFLPTCGADKVEDLRKCAVDCHFDDGTYCICGRDYMQTICAEPTPDPNCPPFFPNQGVSCSSNATCMYGLMDSCAGTFTYAACVGGVWITGMGGGCHD